MSRRKHAKSSQDAVYEAALDEFAEYGLAGARVDRIARRAGINKAMIYYHFGSKQSLYDAIVKDIAETALAGVRGSIGRTATLEDVLLAMARSHVEGLGRGTRTSRILLHELAAGGRTFERIVAGLGAREELKSVITEMIEAGKREGRYRDVDTLQAVISFLGMSIFYLMVSPMADKVWGTAGDAEFKQRRPQAVVDLFMHGLEAR